MKYIIRFTKPGGIVEYWPRDYGFRVHKHTADVAEAERFDTYAAAQRSLSGYINPPAFWESERQHANAVREKVKNWICEVIPE